MGRPGPNAKEAQGNEPQLFPAAGANSLSPFDDEAACNAKLLQLRASDFILCGLASPLVLASATPKPQDRRPMSWVTTGDVLATSMDVECALLSTYARLVIFNYIAAAGDGRGGPALVGFEGMAGAGILEQVVTRCFAGPEWPLPSPLFTSAFSSATFAASLLERVTCEWFRCAGGAGETARLRDSARAASCRFMLRRSSWRQLGDGPGGTAHAKDARFAPVLACLWKLLARAFRVSGQDLPSSFPSPPVRAVPEPFELEIDSCAEPGLGLALMVASALVDADKDDGAADCVLDGLVQCAAIVEAGDRYTSGPVLMAVGRVLGKAGTGKVHLSITAQRAVLVLRAAAAEMVAREGTDRIAGMWYSSHARRLLRFTAAAELASSCGLDAKGCLVWDEEKLIHSVLFGH